MGSRAGKPAVFSAQNFPGEHLHTVTLSNVTVAGNALPVFHCASSQSTLCHPSSRFLDIRRARARALTRPGAVTGDDVARVEFRQPKAPPAAVASAPFAASFTLPTDRTSTTVSAVAVDLTGNRSVPFEQTVTIQPNAPPVVTLTNLSGGTDVRQGQTLTFQVHASDDASLAQILFSSVRPACSSTTQAIPNKQADFNGTFTGHVPLTAATGQTTVQAAATDNAVFRAVGVALYRFVMATGLSSASSPCHNAVGSTVRT